MRIKDREFFNRAHKSNFCYDIWRPSNEVIVLGRNSNESDDVKQEAYDNGIEIRRRIGGGGTVYLNSGTLVLDIAYITENRKDFRYYYKTSNNFIISALNKMGIPAETENSFYDMVIEKKKFGGVSLFISKNKILYSASIIIKETTIDLINKYLNIPDRQPDYRNNRDHIDFLTSLGQYMDFDIKKLKSIITDQLESYKSNLDK